MFHLGFDRMAFVGFLLRLLTDRAVQVGDTEKYDQPFTKLPDTNAHVSKAIRKFYSLKAKQD